MPDTAGMNAFLKPDPSRLGSLIVIGVKTAPGGRVKEFAIEAARRLRRELRCQVRVELGCDCLGVEDSQPTMAMKLLEHARAIVDAAWWAVAGAAGVEPRPGPKLIVPGKPGLTAAPPPETGRH